MGIAVIALVAVPSCTQAEQATHGEKPASIAVGERPRAIIAADFNGDGRIDIAVANADGDSVSILLGDRAGDFARTDFPGGNEPADIAIADFNADGAVDLAVANHETSSVTILLNDGAGSFSPMPGSPYDTGARPHLHSVAVADFNGDGFADIASDSSDTDSIAVLFGNSGGFEPARQVDVGDFPYYRLGVLPSNVGTQVLVPSPRAHLVGKIDPSNKSGLSVVGDAQGAVMARNGNFAGRGPYDATAIMTDGIVIWHRDGEAYERVSKQPVAFDNPTELAVGDLDGDGRDEIVVGLWESDEIHVVSSEGKRLGSIGACFRPAALHIADLDGDGSGEIIAGCWNETKILIFGSPVLSGQR
ncbi:VCBS repeat-containing protein [Erythrobacter sp. JK5]|uniref:FG-GAP repeat domain-containing protein n=1 Tax=Erythrobacter sp. JK5 TaxID=2829500 RepID=UPI001BAD2829|nr:VCBS repeat-containing protein [Erythrobacter sp. JK5]QUL38511.1 VCBS repeat-containing protein [Erythrobacter sp. JK5]